MIFFQDEDWIIAYHNEANFDLLYKEKISQTIQIESNPVKIENVIVKIVDFD